MTQLTRLMLIGVLIFFPAWMYADPLKFDGAPLVAAQDGTVDFLPVEEAYQLHPRIEGNVLTLEWTIAPGYYLYQERFNAVLIAEKGGAGSPLQQTFEPGVVRYDEYYDKELEVYYGSTSVSVALPDITGTANLRVSSQGCADAGLCYPPRTHHLGITPDGAVTILDQPPPPPRQATPANRPQPLLIALGFALLGGLILNLMPCVFPVLSIKVLSLATSHSSPRTRHLHGLAYTFGAVITFVGVALLLMALRAGGEALGWGFQLQSPAFVTALIYLFFLMGLTFSGFFTAGTGLMNFGQSAAAGNGLRHSFLGGVLATVVASPCSAPFMGTALGFALTQPAPIALMIFATLGLGMALPFLLLSWAPGFLGWLPKPGQWMETLKELLAFPLYFTCIWLLWILGRQAGTDALAATLAGLTLLGFAIWLGKKRHAVARIAAAAVTLSAVLVPYGELTKARDTGSLWEPYSETRLEELLEEQRGVFVNLTADWCITCLANEKIALSSDEFANTLRSRGIIYLKGDWTNSDPAITRLLNANGRNGVPLYLFYPPGQQKPVVLPQILSKAIVIDALTPDS